MALERLRAEMARREIPSALLASATDVRWATGFTGSFGRVLVTTDDALFITDARYGVQSAEEVTGMPREVFSSPRKADEVVAEMIAAMGITRLGFDSGKTTVAGLKKLQEKSPNVEFVATDDLTGPLRLVKTADEIARIRRACGLADAAFSHVVPLLHVGMRELDVALEIEFFFRRQGAGIAFDVIAVSGERSARPHGTPSEKPLEKGDFLTMDFGATLDGYHSDITRTVVIGSASAAHREVYDLVLKSQLGALAHMRPGVTRASCDARAREIMGDAAAEFGHSLGHSLGLMVHDGGGLRAGEEDMLREGEVWTVEPGIYRPGLGGVRIEDDVVVTSDGVEILTKSTKELLEVGF